MSWWHRALTACGAQLFFLACMWITLALGLTTASAVFTALWVVSFVSFVFCSIKEYWNG